MQKSQADKNRQIFIRLRHHLRKLVGQVFVDVLAELSFFVVFHEVEVCDV